MTNDAIADRLDAFAAVLELGEANPYTIRAYRRAAETIRGFAAPVDALVAAGRGRELRGVGPGIEARLRELVATGAIAELAELERDVAPELVGLARHLGLSTRRALEIARALGIHGADELRAAADAGRLREVPGIGPATESRIRDALASGVDGRAPRALLLDRAERLLDGIARAVGATVAGDVRRGAERGERLTLVRAAAREAEVSEVLDAFAGLPQVVAVIERGERRAVGVTLDGVPVTLAVPTPEAFGTALVRATGTPEYVAALGALPDRPDESALYAALGIPWCPPELREAPCAGVAPVLVARAQIRGDLHVHTVSSDGRASVEEMALAARALGHDYLAICDHTPAVGAVRGLSADDVRRQGEEIEAVNARLAPFRVLRGIECDILPDGRLDLPDDVLAELDWVQASVHGGQRMARGEMTRRVEEALSHPAVRCLSHPTGRLIGRRPESAVDLDRVYEVARAHGVRLEVNGLPARLDLSGSHVADAIAAGVQVVCSTDAHSPAGLDNLRFAVVTARRGGATADDVANTRPLDALLAR